MLCAVRPPITPRLAYWCAPVHLAARLLRPGLRLTGSSTQGCPHRPQRSTEFLARNGQPFFIHSLAAHRKHVVGAANFPQIQNKQARFHQGQDRATSSLSRYRQRRAIVVIKMYGELFPAAVALHAGIRAMIHIYLRYNCYLEAVYVDPDQQRFNLASKTQ